MSSYDGSRSARQSKRYSVTAYYLSMSAKDKELEIDDDLAKGENEIDHLWRWDSCLHDYSSEDSQRVKGANIVAIQEELCARERCQIP
jgi:hypothetical protein